METLEDLADKMANEDQAKVRVDIPGLELEVPLELKSLNQSMVATLEGKIMTAIWVEVVDQFITSLEFNDRAQQFVDLLDWETIGDMLWIASNGQPRAKVGTIIRKYIPVEDVAELAWFAVTGEVDVDKFDKISVNVIEAEEVESG